MAYPARRTSNGACPGVGARGSKEARVVTGSTPSACVADPYQMALIDSGASDHMIGRDSLTKLERSTIYKVAPIAYCMSKGSLIMDEAVDLWVPFLGKHLSFRVSDGGGKPIFSEGRLCREEGFTSPREPYFDVLTLTNSDGVQVNVTMQNSCGYVPMQNTPSAASSLHRGRRVVEQRWANSSRRAWR